MIYNNLRIIIFLVLLLVKGSGIVTAQFRDTTLNTIISKPFFYNVVLGGESRIFAGTSEGIYEIKGVSISHYGSQKGYITTDKEGKPVIDKNGIKYHRDRTYSYLLPYSTMGGEREYHVSNDKQFYLCSGGRLTIFDIMPFKYDYPNHSIRSISKDLLGTYSGIYLKGKKLGEPAPPFTDGYVRQIGDRGFVCSHQLLILEKEAMASGNLRLDSNCFNYSEPNGLLISDILATGDGKSYYLATLDKLLLTDFAFKKDSILFRKSDKNLPVGLIPGDSRFLYFSAGKELLSISLADNEIKHILQLEEPIRGGVFFEDQIYLITENTLYRYNSDHKLEKLADLEQAHTLIRLVGDQLLIGSNLGLFHFNLVSNTLSVLIKNVEFNRGAIYSDFDRTTALDNIIAGSINGLYTFRVSDIPEMIAGNKPQLEEKTIPGFTNIILGGLSISLLLLLGISVSRYRKKLKSARTFIQELQTPKEEITKEVIEEYIRNNLPHASIKTLTDEFDLNAPQLYNILKPERPGSIIQKIRTEKVKEMREKNQSLKEISEATGLSETYLKKFKT